MKSLKQLREDPRIYEIAQNPDWSAEEATDYPDWHTPKYSMVLNDGFMFDDGSHYNGADTVKELNELLDTVMNETEGYQ